MPFVIVVNVGAPGTVAGVAGPDGKLGALVPSSFVAVTVNVYVVPFVRPVTVQVTGTGVVSSVVHVAPPGDAVAV